MLNVRTGCTASRTANPTDMGSIITLLGAALLGCVSLYALICVIVIRAKADAIAKDLRAIHELLRQRAE